MPRTHKTLSKQNLSKLPVLIEDRGVESTYFNIKQLSGVFTGGRNGFLISGTPFLKPGTEVLVELLDTDGNSIYVEAIKGFVEGSARLIVIEIYQETPPGTAILTVVGTAQINADTKVQLPNSQTNSQNVRWQKKIIIEPRSNNKTPLRIKKQPEVLVEELLVTSSLLSQSKFNVDANFNLIPINKDKRQQGYTIQVINGTPFASYQTLPKITGSLFLETRQYTTAIPPTTSSYTVIQSDTASVDLPIKLFNASTSFADINITSSVTGDIINVTPLLTGSYQITSSAYSASDSQYIQTVTIVTSSVTYQYISESITTNPSQSLSLAKVRIINLDTVSGEIYRVKTSNKPAASQLDFSTLADTPTTVGELLVSSSVIVNEREIPIGIFNSDNILRSNWYSYLLTGSTIPDVAYYNSTSSSSSHFTMSRNDAHILDASYVATASNNYFFATKNNFAVFPTSEYTFKIDAYVYTTSASYAYTSSQYDADIYLVGSAIVGNDPLGQKIGTLTTANQVAYFKDQTFNFRVPLSGSLGVRIIPKSGFWEFANVSIKVAEEFAFSPDEVTLIIPNDFKYNDLLLYKTSFYDINNNALGLDGISSPTYFTGSRQYVLRSGDTMTGELYIHNFPIYNTILQDSITGLMEGGIITVNPSYSQAYDISSGSGYIINGYSNPYSASYTYVSWSAFTGVTASAFPSSGSFASWDRTNIAITANGTILEQQNPFTAQQYRQNIILGRLAHVGTTSIQRTLSLPLTAYNQGYHWFDLSQALGIINVTGNVYSPYTSSATLQLQKSAGKTYRVGSNYKFDTTYPDVTTDTALSPVTFAYRYRSGSGFAEISATSYVTGSLYDDGSGTLQPVANNRYTVQRIYFFGATATTRIQFGQNIYQSMDAALAAASTEVFIADPNLASDASLRAYLVLKGDASNLNTSTDARFVTITGFGQGGGGGGGATTLGALSDVDSTTSPIDGDILIYSGSLWRHQPMFPYTGSVNISGSATITGDVIVKSLTETSTIKVKENIRPIDSTMEVLQKFEPIKFNWKDNKKEDIGFIAEHISSIYPDVVEYDTNGNPLGIHYSKLTVVLIKAMQEMAEEIKQLKETQ